MRVLLDECVDERLRNWIIDYHCESARYAGFSGLKNGALLLAAETAGFDVLITVDQNMPDQQNLSSRHLALLILHARTNRLADLKELIPAMLISLASIRPGQVVRIER